MTDFIIKKLPYDLTSNAGLVLVGQYTKRLGISALVDHKFPVAVGGIPIRDIVKSLLGLLVQGKNDFDAIEEFCADAFFTRVLDVNTAPLLLDCMEHRAGNDYYVGSSFYFATHVIFTAMPRNLVV